jgi:FixJ family two-component response regulator
MQDWSRWTERLHPEDREHVLQVFEGVLGGDTTTCEYRIVRPDGLVRWIRDTLFPIRDEHGRVRRAAGLAQNITRNQGALVYVVDGGEAPRQALTRLLEGAGYEVKVFATVRAFLDAAPVLVPGCALLDVSPVHGGGLSVPWELRARRIGLPVIATGKRRGDAGLAIQAMKAGAIDYLEAPYTTKALLAAVASALAGIQDAALHDRAAEDARTRVAALSAREREVLDGLLRGGTNKTIGKELGISPRTVEIHRAHLMDRLGAHTLPEVVLKATAGLKRAHHRTGAKGAVMAGEGATPNEPFL